MKMQRIAGMGDMMEEEAPMMDKGMEMASEETPMTEEGSPTEGGVFIPTEALKGASFKAGDTITMKVVGVDQDGLQVEYATAPTEDDGYTPADQDIDQAAM